MDYKVDPQARYTKTHEWVRVQGKEAVLGVTDYAQHLLSDVVYVELPSRGDTLTKGESFATIESVKAAEDVYAPVDGEILEVNAELENSPEWVNHDPYGKAWLVKVKLGTAGAPADLMDADAYQAFVAKQEEEGSH